MSFILTKPAEKNSESMLRIACIVKHAILNHPERELPG
jgi:hypothetical protein